LGVLINSFQFVWEKQKKELVYMGNFMDYKCPSCGVEVCPDCGQCSNSKCEDALCPQLTGAITEDVWEVIEFGCPECGNVESISSDKLIHMQVPGTNKSGTCGYEYCTGCGAYILVIV
jgi:hypothetical protein